MRYALSDLLEMIPTSNGVGENTGRYWLKTGLFGAVMVYGGGGPGQPRLVDFHGAAAFLVAAELYAHGYSGAGFEQAIISIAHKIRTRWREINELRREIQTLKANQGSGAQILLEIQSNSPDHGPIFNVRSDWEHPRPFIGRSELKLSLSSLLMPLVSDSTHQFDIPQGVMIPPAKLAERYNYLISTRTLANWRTLGQGPRFVKVGARVFYPSEAIEEWERRRTLGKVSLC